MDAGIKIGMVAQSIGTATKEHSQILEFYKNIATVDKRGKAEGERGKKTSE